MVIIATHHLKPDASTLRAEVAFGEPLPAERGVAIGGIRRGLSAAAFSH